MFVFVRRSVRPVRVRKTLAYHRLKGELAPAMELQLWGGVWVAPKGGSRANVRSDVRGVVITEVGAALNWTGPYSPSH